MAILAKRPGIFPTFFLSGFECSTFRWKDNRRRNLIKETQHDKHVREDYQLLRDLGIAVAREGVPWPFVDKDGQYDFSPIDPMIDAMNEAQVIPIWSLCQYGYPDDLDPFSEEFTDRFVRYCRAAAEYVVPRVHGPFFLLRSTRLHSSHSPVAKWVGSHPIKIAGTIALGFAKHCARRPSPA